MFLLALENQRKRGLYHVYGSTRRRETKVPMRCKCFGGDQILELDPETSQKPIPDCPQHSPEVFGGGWCWLLKFSVIHLFFYNFIFLFWEIFLDYCFLNWIYWGDIDSWHHTGFKCTTWQNIICTLHCAPTNCPKQSLLSPLKCWMIFNSLPKQHCLFSQKLRSHLQNVFSITERSVMMLKSVFFIKEIQYKCCHSTFTLEARK